MKIRHSTVQDIPRMMEIYSHARKFMADHGNDPNIGHSKHTRECVPLLIRYRDAKGIQVGLRSTLSDVGATVCDYFGVKAPQNGTSFYGLFK